MVNIEICISSDNLPMLERQVLAAINGGAKRVELCGNMQEDGLTPSYSAIELASSVLTDAQALMVMIRPRKGGFYYSLQEIQQMRSSIIAAAKFGAKGVVFGLLDATETELAITDMQSLVELATENGLEVTCHRAFDVLSDPLAGLAQLKALGVTRVLTAAGKWGQPSLATDNAEVFSNYLRAAQGELEIICCGGITPQNAALIVAQQKPIKNESSNCLSLHAYSGVLTDGLVSESKVALLCSAANNA
ncbi:copper homeostasis protein CutC [Paraglaciecola arctica]|uniref:Copper homeostasis protein cutC homolog n=1 Tax=Paraglaciecola arctica BSs20135 TaxID=493475 RepID=K6YQC4_9ALTE|nr:copper homeostasis protein CutC [Paraglaciecola arctica]GAC20357.1 copper homeostasis protein [Paraglaciecola arctica BSs20135]